MYSAVFLLNTNFCRRTADHVLFFKQTILTGSDKETLSDSSPGQELFGAGEGLFTVPENFDDIDISNDFDEEIFPG